MNVGIIGCGNISSQYLRLAALFPGVDIIAVCDLDWRAARARAAEFGVRALGIDDLLASEEIDVIVNLTVPSAHYAVTRSVLEAGKHAYCEKPVVLNLEDGKALADLAAQNGLRIGAAPDTFLGGVHQQARALIDAGAIGTITGGTAHVMSHGMEDWHPNPDFFFQPGAGPMLDLGPYYISNLVQLIGPVARVAALSSSATPTRTIGSQPRQGEVIAVQTPTNIHALLEFAQGATVTLSTSWDVWAHRHGHMEIYGTQGSLFLPDPNFFSGPLTQAGPDGTSQNIAPWDHPLGVVNEDGVANYRMAGLADMIAAIGENRPHRCDLTFALHVTDVMVSILRSGDSRDFIDMTTTCAKPAALNPQAARDLMT